MFEQVTRRRRNGKVARLPIVLRDSVDKMLSAGVSYREIVDFLGKHDVEMSRQAVCNYAKNFLATTQQLRMAQENYKVLLEEMQRMPEMDVAEAVLRILSNALLNKLATATEEDWQSMNFATIVKESNVLVKIAAQKRRVDTQNASEVDKAVESIKANVFSALHTKEPELVSQFTKALEAVKEDLEE